jgi:hypothetical protein
MESLIPCGNRMVTKPIKDEEKSSALVGLGKEEIKKSEIISIGDGFEGLKDGDIVYHYSEGIRIKDVFIVPYTDIIACERKGE